MHTSTSRLNQVFRLTDVAADSIQHQAERYGYRRAFASAAAVPFTLVQTNSAGQALASQEIYLVNDDDTGEIQYFLEVAPMAQDTARVQIRQGSAVLAERSASAPRRRPCDLRRRMAVRRSRPAPRCAGGHWTTTAIY